MNELVSADLDSLRVLYWICSCTNTISAISLDCIRAEIMPNWIVQGSEGLLAPCVHNNLNTKAFFIILYF